MKYLVELFYYIYLTPFRWFLSLDREHKFFGPVWGSELSKDMFDRLHAYRLNFYERHLPYLSPNSDEQRAAELLKDKRSMQLWAQDSRGNIVGSCMFMPHPFEVSYAIEKSIDQDHSNYLEVSRLLVSKQRRGIGMRLLFQGGPVIVPQRKFGGILGICKTARMSMFGLVGMKVIGNVQIEERGGQTYNVISASMNRLVFLMNIIAINSVVSNLLTFRMISIRRQFLGVLAFLMASVSASAAAASIELENVALINDQTAQIDSPSVSRDGNKICWVGVKKDRKNVYRNQIFVKDLLIEKIFAVKKSGRFNGDTRCHFTPDDSLIVDEILWRPLALIKTAIYIRHTKDVEPQGFASRLVSLDLGEIVNGARKMLNKFNTKDLNLTSKRAYLKHSQVSPDGRYLTYYVSHEYPKDMGLYIFDLVNKTNHKLSSEYDKHPTWSKDGNRIYFHYQFERHEKVEESILGYFDLTFSSDRFISSNRVLLSFIDSDYVYHKHPVVDSNLGLVFFHGQTKHEGKKQIYVRKPEPESPILELKFMTNNGEPIVTSKHPATDYHGGLVFLGKTKTQKNWVIYKINSESLTKIAGVL